MSSRHSTSSSNGGGAGSGWTGARHTVFLRVHSADKLQLSTSQSSYCKVYIGETPVVTSTTNMSNLLNDKPLPDHRAFHTKVTTSKLKTTALWNEKFEVPVDNIKKQILSVRVKSHHQLYSPSIGSCAIPLKQLKTNTTIDQHFPLFKGSTQCGTIRLQLMIRDNQPGRGEEEVRESKAPRSRVASDDASKQRRREQEAEEKQRQQREKLEQEKRRIEQEMERLRIEEKELARRKLEEEERRKLEEERRKLEEERLEAERAEKEREKEEKLRRKQLEEEELTKKLLAESMLRKKAKSISSDNQAEEVDSNSRTSSSMTVLTADDPEGGRLSDVAEGKPLRESSKSVPAMKTRRSSPGERRRNSTMSLRDVIDEVVQDALPSDSDSDSDELDTEDEHEFVRKMAKLKLKLLKRKKLRQSMSLEKDNVRRSSLECDKEKSKAKKSKKHRKYSITSSDSPSSSSSSSSSEDEKNARKSKKKKHTKAKQQQSDSSSDDEDQRRKSQKAKKNKQDDGLIKVLAPGEIYKRSGGGQSEQLSMGQVMEAAINVANLAAADEDDDVTETVTGTVETLHSLAPIGRFIGRKIHEASAKVAQMKEKEQPTYYF
jgi:hypothetical protein